MAGLVVVTFEVEIVSVDDHREWLRSLGQFPRERVAAAIRYCREHRRTHLWWLPGGFGWMCPHCGFEGEGRLGERAKGGMREPRWVNMGSVERPSLVPALGCPRWKQGACTGGHWWLRTGVLEAA